MPLAATLAPALLTSVSESVMRRSGLIQSGSGLHQAEDVDIRITARDDMVLAADAGVQSTAVGSPSRILQYQTPTMTTLRCALHGVLAGGLLGIEQSHPAVGCQRAAWICAPFEPGRNIAPWHKNELSH
jgi:hypothetical protein